jgi:hypothetical protein
MVIAVYVCMTIMTAVNRYTLSVLAGYVLLNEAAEDHICKVNDVRATLRRWLQGQTLTCLGRRRN